MKKPPFTYENLLLTIAMLACFGLALINSPSWFRWLAFSFFCGILLFNGNEEK